MSAASLSVGFSKATAITASSSNPSSSSTDKLSFSSIHFPFRVTKPINFSKLKPHHDFVKFAPFSLFSRCPFICALAAFDGFETSQTAEPLDEEEEETATQDEVQGEEEAVEESDGASVLQSIDARRLYVGNLPYSMTSSQLSDVFSECGRVASVEVSL